MYDLDINTHNKLLSKEILFVNEDRRGPRLGSAVTRLEPVENPGPTQTLIAIFKNERDAWDFVLRSPNRDVLRVNAVTFSLMAFSE